MYTHLGDFGVGVTVPLCRRQVHQLLRVHSSERRSAPSSLIRPQARSLHQSGEAPYVVRHSTCLCRHSACFGMLEAAYWTAGTDLEVHLNHLGVLPS